jgi:rhodanese-related sulfurtransferase
MAQPSGSPPGPQVPSIGVEEARRRLSQPGSLLIDVRETWEYESGHVPGAILVPLQELASRLGEIPKERAILVICQVGQRSATAAALLLSRGFPEVTNVDGGTTAWTRAGFPLER